MWENTKKSEGMNKHKMPSRVSEIVRERIIAESLSAIGQFLFSQQRCGIFYIVHIKKPHILNCICHIFHYPHMCHYLKIRAWFLKIVIV